MENTATSLETLSYQELKDLYFETFSAPAKNISKQDLILALSAPAVSVEPSETASLVEEVECVCLRNLTISKKNYQTGESVFLHDLELVNELLSEKFVVLKK